MFKNTFQSGFLSILYSIGSKPLQLWHIEVDQGHVKVGFIIYFFIAYKFGLSFDSNLFVYENLISDY